MRYRRTLAVTAVLTCVFASAPSPARAATGYEMAIWMMDESRGSHWMADSTGRGHNGRIGPDVGIGMATESSHGYRFDRLEPDTPPARPGHLVSVPDHPDLDPGDRDFAVTVRLRTTHKFGNIIQKGQATVPGGSFKMQIPSGRPTCTFRGSVGTREMWSPVRINDGNWHTVRCLRIRDGVALLIDGQEVVSKPGWTGTIANTWPVSIGGKLDCDQVDVGCDYYAGDLDWIMIEAA